MTVLFTIQIPPLSSYQYVCFLSDTRSNPSSSLGSVLLVAGVRTSRVDATLADVVTVTADDLSARGGDGAETLASLGVTEGEDWASVSRFSARKAQRINLPAVMRFATAVESWLAALWTS
jgi:hypothetical protein